MFIRPHFLYLFIPLLIVFGISYKKKRLTQSWADICDPHLLTFLTKEGSKHLSLSKLLLFCMSTLMILALSGPSWQIKPHQTLDKHSSLMVLLNLSAEMSAKDIKPSRLARAKFKLNDLFNILPETDIGLIAFTKEAFLVSPLTQDTETLKLFFPELRIETMPIGGSNISQAIKLAQQSLLSAGKSTGHILLLTTGSASREALRAAKSAYQHGYRVDILAFGTRLGAPIINEENQQVMSKLNKAMLKKLALSGGGIYQSITNSDKDIQALAHNITSNNAVSKQQQNILNTRSDDGYFLLWLMLPLILIFFRQGFLKEAIS